MSYFNLFHIVALIIIIAIFIGFTALIILKEKRVKTAMSFLIVNVTVMSCITVISMMLIDRYTKVAVIENLVGKRILIKFTTSIL